MDDIIIGGSLIGSNHPAIIISEFGINHQGDMKVAKRMIDAAIDSGCNAGKFQTRDVDIVYTKEELSRPRESPFGDTNEALKRGLEFGQDEYMEIDAYCKSRDFTWFSSCWCEESVDLIAKYNPPCFKIASACLTDDDLLKYHRQFRKPIILSTGMSTLLQIDHAVEVLGTDNLVILHCCSVYPANGEQLNLRCIQTLQARYDCPIGYSGHELGLATTVAAVAMGARVVERHICLNRADWGSDMSASVEPQGMKRLVRDIREVERAMGDGVKRVLDEELPIAKKLRRVDSQNLQ